MEIRSTLTNRSGQILPYVYRDVDSEQEIGDKQVSGVHAFCFYGDKLVIVYSEAKGYWTPPGGGVEAGESIEDALLREVKEETNMRVLKHKLIGCLDISEPERVVTQARFACLAEPMGPFLADDDPEGDVTEIKLIDPADMKKYFDWGENGDRLLERALEAKVQMEAEIVRT